MSSWESYEEVCRHILNEFKEKFGLQKIEGKQLLVGKETGTQWEVDAKGLQEGTEAIIIIEARRYTTSKQNQEKLAALAYRIQDTGAEGGIIVSPLGVQAGAEKVANANNIISVKINAECTPEQFGISFFGDTYTRFGVAKLGLKAHKVTVKHVRKK